MSMMWVALFLKENKTVMAQAAKVSGRNLAQFFGASPFLAGPFVVGSRHFKFLRFSAQNVFVIQPYLELQFKWWKSVPQQNDLASVIVTPDGQQGSLIIINKPVVWRRKSNVKKLRFFIYVFFFQESESKEITSRGQTKREDFFSSQELEEETGGGGGAPTKREGAVEEAKGAEEEEDLFFDDDFPVDELLDSFTSAAPSSWNFPEQNLFCDIKLNLDHFVWTVFRSD